ncbi:MAG: hypothetical protein WDW38_008469 [Sanguina aurantia]
MLQLEDIVAGYPDEDGGPNNIILDGVRFKKMATGMAGTPGTTRCLRPAHDCYAGANVARVVAGVAVGGPEDRLLRPAHGAARLRIADGRRGYLSGLGDYFHDAAGAPVTGTLPAAAITRNHVAKDADGHTWLSADPAWVQPEMNGVRLLACGHMQLTQAEAEAYAEALQPALEDAGMALYLSTPDRWHLRLPPGTPLPDFARQSGWILDRRTHLPATAVRGRRWRILLNDMQVLLHQHPLNTARQNRGVAPVNCRWLWGGASRHDGLLHRPEWRDRRRPAAGRAGDPGRHRSGAAHTGGCRRSNARMADRPAGPAARRDRIPLVADARIVARPASGSPPAANAGP